MKALKLVLAAALALSLANADGKAKKFKFSGAKTSVLLAKCNKKDAATCYEAAMRYELGGRGVVRQSGANEARRLGAQGELQR